ncbi:hypothetical protein EB151_06275, partial [archaeon]|nr:hypothetical protein [archaeon]
MTAAKALILSLIVGFIYCLFALGFYVRTLKGTSFIINAQNKDPQKGLGWYQERIIEQAQDMRFFLKINERELKQFSPQGL